MDTSNIFVYVELTKLVENLSTSALLLKQKLKSQAGYFNIIPPKYFSDALYPEWESITEVIRRNGPQYDKDGRVVANAFVNTIEQMSQQECSDIATRIKVLQEKVKQEFE